MRDITRRNQYFHDYKKMHMLFAKAHNIEYIYQQKRNDQNI